MDATTLLITVSCLIDDWLAGQRLRQPGPQPILSDSEVLTIECVGEFLGIDTDKGLYQYFCRHYRDWFPGPFACPSHQLRPPGGQPVGGKAQLRQQLLGPVGVAPATLHDLTLAEDLLAGATGGRWATGPPGARLEPGCWPTRGVAAGTVRSGQAARATPARQTGLGPPRLASVVPLAAQAPQPHLAVYLCQQTSLGSLRFADLLTS